VEIDRNMAMSLATGMENFHHHAAAIDMIHDHDWEFSKCNFGRVHTNITRLKREFRRALRIHGKRLVNLDVSNSQPLIFGLVLLAYRLNNNRLLRFQSLKDLVASEAEKYRYRELSHVFPDGVPLPICNRIRTEDHDNEYGTGQHVHMVRNRTYSNANAALTDIKGVRTRLADDEQKYIELCEEGRLYEYLQERSGNACLTRERLKEAVYKDIYFGTNRANTPLTDVFKSYFPGVWASIRQIKHKDYRHAAHWMQRYESSLVIGSVCDRLRREMPELPLLTIHDSIATVEGAEGHVENAFREEFGRVGLVPRLKSERWE
jgi:hypothetical protein